MKKIPSEINIKVIGSDNFTSQIHFDVYEDGRLHYREMSAAGVMDVIRGIHDTHEFNRKESLDDVSMSFDKSLS